MSWKVLFLSLVLFLAVFLPRFYQLDIEGINPDEDTWHLRIDNFTAAVREGNWFYTQQSLHPAVTFEWLAAGGRVLAGLGAKTSPETFWDEFRPRHQAMVLPIVLVTSLSVVGVYLLLLRLFGPSTSFVASLLIAWDPFFLAHSRVVQMDALLASFMILSVLSFLVYVKERRRGLLVLSALMGGLAILTKLPALFLVPFVLLVSLLDVRSKLRYYNRNSVVANYYNRSSVVANFSSRLLEFAVWFLVLTVTFVALYPAMWVQPFLTVRNLIYGLVGRGLTAGGEGVGTTFYLGQIVERPGALFYPLVLALRSTPLTFIFGIVGGVCLPVYASLQAMRKPTPVAKLPNRQTAYLLIFTLFFTLQMTIVAKAGDRYLLPAFLGLDILAGYGLVRVIPWDKLKVFIPLCLLVTSYWLLLSPLRSCYLTYYNPLFGGGRTAEKLMVVGWGEGLREAAEYLNQQPNAETLKVAAFYPDSLQTYFAGEVWEIGEKGDSGADYVVLYVNMIQRKRHPQFIEKYYENAVPEQVITLNGIKYAWIYEVY